MGLDNGIIVKREDAKKFPPLMKFKDDYDDEEVHVAYFRKCWNVREKIFEILSKKDDGHYNPDGEITALTVEDVEDIISALEAFTEEQWGEDYHYSDTIWDASVGMRLLERAISGLYVLRAAMYTDPSIEASFYDSY